MGTLPKRSRRSKPSFEVERLRGRQKGLEEFIELLFLDNNLIEDGIAMCIFPGIPNTIFIGSSWYLACPEREECGSDRDLGWFCGCLSHEVLHLTLVKIGERKASRRLDKWNADGNYRRSGLSNNQASAIAANDALSMERCYFAL